MPPDERTAYHEAGHAVVALLLGLSLESASARPLWLDGRFYGGVVRFRDYPADVDSWCRMLLAGEAAEVLRFGGTTADSCGRDLDQARRWAVWKGESDPDAYLRQQAAEVRELLRQPVNWAAVRLLAKALMSQEVLGGAAVREVTDGAEAEAWREVGEKVRELVERVARA
jgi:hypothetical protein